MEGADCDRGNAVGRASGSVLVGWRWKVCGSKVGVAAPHNSEGWVMASNVLQWGGGVRDEER